MAEIDKEKGIIEIPKSHFKLTDKDKEVIDMHENLHREENKFLQSVETFKNLKVGDKVEIIGNIPFQLKNKPRPLLARVTAIDGLYITVRPKYQRYECEFYPSELKKI